MRWKWGLAALVAVSGSTCELNSVAPEVNADNLALANGLVAKLVVEPTEVAPGGAFTARYSLTNSSRDPVRMKSSCVSIARGVVLQGGEQREFIGSGSGCYTAIGTFEIPAGETFERNWQVEAAIVVRAHPDGSREVVEAEPGDYLFRVVPDVFEIDGSEARLPTLEQRVIVRRFFRL